MMNEDVDKILSRALKNQILRDFRDLESLNLSLGDLNTNEGFKKYRNQIKILSEEMELYSEKVLSGEEEEAEVEEVKEKIKGKKKLSDDFFLESKENPVGNLNIPQAVMKSVLRTAKKQSTFGAEDVMSELKSMDMELDYSQSSIEVQIYSAIKYARKEKDWIEQSELYGKYRAKKVDEGLAQVDPINAETDFDLKKEMLTDRKALEGTLK